MSAANIDDARDYLYKDKFCDLSKTNLTLFCFYPTFQSRKIEISKIRTVFFEKQRCSLSVKYWGMGFSNIWWAHDWQRQFCMRHYNIAVNVGECTAKGFSVENMDEFMNALKPLLGPNVDLIDHI